MLNYVIEKINKYINKKYFKRYFDWFIHKFELIEKSEKLENNRKK